MTSSERAFRKSAPSTISNSLEYYLFYIINECWNVLQELKAMRLDRCWGRNQTLSYRRKTRIGGIATPYHSDEGKVNLRRISPYHKHAQVTDPSGYAVNDELHHLSPTRFILGCLCILRYQVRNAQVVTVDKVQEAPFVPLTSHQ